MKAVRAKKFLGQHFLINEGIAKKITDLISKKNNKNVLEIGPGMGVLTKYLEEKDYFNSCLKCTHKISISTINF